MPKRSTFVILDAHAIIHRAYHALPPLTAPTGAPVSAVYGLTAMLIKLLKDLKPDYLVAAYDLPGPTHRHDVYKEYKGKRPKLDDELALQLTTSRTALEAFGIPILEAPGYEADDIIGTLALRLKDTHDVIIASGDMDTLQLVDDTRVRVYTLRKGIQDTMLYDERAVHERFGFPPSVIPDYKGIAGDPSDNIMGIPGVGVKGATDLLHAFGSLEAIYAALDKNKNALVERGFRERLQALVMSHRDEAEFSKVLATIRTDAPITAAEFQPFLTLWSEARAVALCESFGFRSLISRIRALSLAPGAGATRAEAEPEPKADPALLQACAVMTWLLNSEMTNPTLDDIYTASGAHSVRDALPVLQKRITKENLDRVYRSIEEPLIPVIDALNRTGIKVDAPYLGELSAEYRIELNDRAKKIYRAAGVEFNIASPKQLGEVLFGTLGLKGARQKKTATGQFSTKESELLKLKDQPIVADILAHRELSKLLGTYIDAIPPLLGGDGRLRTTFSQTGTTTGRLSSRDPNLQNIPIKTELGRRIRRAFVAEHGHTLLAMDYSQIELRLAAILSGDEKLIEIFVRGEDVHAAVAAQVFGVPQDAVTKEMRRRAKVINFGILYGMGVNALREQLGTERKEAQEFYTRYFETFQTLATYLEKTRESAARAGFTTTYFGRKRFFPGITSSLPFVRAQAERMAINAPIQGTQADIIKIAMVRIHELFEQRFSGRAAIVLQIHDELIFEVMDDSVSAVAHSVKEIMEGVLPHSEARVPITVSAEAGENWAELTPL